MTQQDVVCLETQYLVAALLGRVEPGPVRDAWSRNELALRIRALAAALPSFQADKVPLATLTKVFAHPAVGSIARSDAANSPHAWAPVSAALRVCMHDYASVISELRHSELWKDQSVHLPGTGLVCATATGEMRTLDVIGGIEVNNVDRALTSWTDHVDANVTDDWRVMVRDAVAFIADLGIPDFTNAASLTTVLVPLLQRDGSEFGRSSKLEIENGSVTDAVGAAYISPGTGDPVCFAEALIHESYHNLFNMALDIEDFEMETSEEFYSPWKGTTRPTRAVLHGIVAFSSVMRFWQHLGETETSWSKYAAESVARRAEEILEAAAAVLSGGVLTDVGAELAEAAASDARVAI